MINIWDLLSVLLVLLAAVFIVLFGNGLSEQFHTSVSLLIVLLSAILYSRWFASKQAADIDEWTSTSLYNFQAGVASSVVKNYRPLVKVLNSHADVAYAARHLMRHGVQRPVYRGAYVVFLGAAANQTRKAAMDAITEIGDSERTPTQIYKGAVEELMSEGVSTYRVLSFLSKEEFGNRSSDKQKQYISWLESQLSQLKRNRSYVLFENRRAPRWGSSGATIFSNYGYLQFTSSTGSALLVNDPWMTRSLLASTMLDLELAANSNKTAMTQMSEEEFEIVDPDGAFGQRVDASALSQHIAELTG